MSRLILLACSQRKRPTPGLLPAIERYDGPLWQTLRLHRKPDHPVLVLALSARFGVIPEDRPIPDYNDRLSPARLQELRRAAGLDPWQGRIAAGGIIAAPLVIGSADYVTLAVDALAEIRRRGLLASPGARPLRPIGAIGSQRWALKQWLANPAVNPSWYQEL